MAFSEGLEITESLEGSFVKLFDVNEILYPYSYVFNVWLYCITRTHKVMQINPNEQSAISHIVNQWQLNSWMYVCLYEQFSNGWPILMYKWTHTKPNVKLFRWVPLAEWTALYTQWKLWTTVVLHSDSFEVHYELRITSAMLNTVSWFIFRIGQKYRNMDSFDISSALFCFFNPQYNIVKKLDTNALCVFKNSLINRITPIAKSTWN